MKIKIAVGVLFLFSLISCTTRKVEPNNASRKLIDSLYQKEVFRLQSEIDEYCKKYSDSLFIVSRDSMMKERLSDMNMLVQ